MSWPLSLASFPSTVQCVPGRLPFVHRYELALMCTGTIQPSYTDHDLSLMPSLLYPTHVSTCLNCGDGMHTRMFFFFDHNSFCAQRRCAMLLLYHGDGLLVNAWQVPFITILFLIKLVFLHPRMSRNTERFYLNQRSRA